MSAKVLLFGEEARHKILDGVNTLADAVMLNAHTREYGDLLAMGVIDPAKVTRLALQNAASIASLLLTTDCLSAAPAAPAGAVAGPGMGAQGPVF